MRSGFRVDYLLKVNFLNFPVFTLCMQFFFSIGENNNNNNNKGRVGGYPQEVKSGNDQTVKFT